MAYTLYHAKGCGSAAVQVALNVLDVRHHLVELNYDDTSARANKDTPEFQALVTANPLGLLHFTHFSNADRLIDFHLSPFLSAQFPTLVTPDGTVLTEVAACLLCESPYGHNLESYLSGSHLLLAARSPRRAARRRYAMGTREPHVIPACVILPLDDLYTREHLSTYYTHGYA